MSSSSDAKRQHIIPIRDMTLRDGLQNLPHLIPLCQKLQIYELLAGAGVAEFQVTSFVNPARIPQLHDAEALFDILSDRPGRHNVLILNVRGFERAVAAGADDMEMVISASESYNRANTRHARAESMAELETIAGHAKKQGVRLGVVLANAFHCSLEGWIEEKEVHTLVDRFVTIGISEVSLADTTGYATPERTADLVSFIKSEFPETRIGAHMHDTTNKAVENALSAVSAGIDWLDATLNGLGGSPFSKGAGANLPIEPLVVALSDIGIETGIDAQEIVAAGKEARSILDAVTMK